MAAIFKYKVNLPNKVEQVKFFLELYKFANKLDLTKADIEVLAYFIIYGVKEETKQLILNSVNLVSGSIKNILSKLTKAGLLIKTERKNGYYVNEELSQLNSGQSIAAMIKIERDEVA